MTGILLLCQKKQEKRTNSKRILIMMKYKGYIGHVVYGDDGFLPRSSRVFSVAKAMKNVSPVRRSFSEVGRDADKNL